LDLRRQDLLKLFENYFFLDETSKFSYTHDGVFVSKYQNGVLELQSTCELIFKLGRLGSRLDECALIYDYSQKIGASKLRIFRNSCDLFLLIFNFFFSDKIKKLSK
jgi:hypothetical protein